MSFLLFGLMLLPATFEEPVIPTEFDQYWMVFLKVGPNRGGTDEERANIQKGHLTHLFTLRKEGKILVAGPLEVEADYPIRGFVLYPGSYSMEEVRAMAEADPAVKAGRLVVEILKWWTGKGAMAFPEPAPK